MFDLDKFRQTTFKAREARLSLAALSEAGLGGDVVVRGLTAHELAQSDEASAKGKLLSDLVERLADASGKQKAAALLEGVGISGDVPQMLAKRYEHVVRGVVSPKFDLSDAVKLGEVFPVEFSQIANKIIELTGLGKQAEVKPAPSGS